MYSLIIFGFLLFLGFTLVYPYVYFKPLISFKVSRDSCELTCVEYRSLRKLRRFRLGDFICFTVLSSSYSVYLDEASPSELVYYDKVSLGYSFFIFSRGRFGRLVSVDPSSSQLQSLLKKVGI